MLNSAYPSAGDVRRVFKEDTVLSAQADGVNNTAAPEKTNAYSGSALSSDALLDLILTSLEDDKAEEIIKIDLRGKSTIADHMVVCSGRSTRQVSALSEKLVEKLKQEADVLAKMEGKDAGDWVLIDAYDVIVHVFRPEVREFYQLEKMWMPASPADTKS